MTSFVVLCPLACIPRPDRGIMTFSEIITTEDQYEVAKAKAEISFYTIYNIERLDSLLTQYFHDIITTGRKE